MNASNADIANTTLQQQELMHAGTTGFVSELNDVVTLLTHSAQ